MTHLQEILRKHGVMIPEVGRISVMENKKLIYSMMNDEERKDVEDILFDAVEKHLLVEKNAGGYSKYIFELQGIEYETYMNEVELNKSIALTVELMEEMKGMNNGGVDKIYLEQLEQSVQKEISTYEFGKDSGFDSLLALKEIETDRIKTIIVELDQVRRVGGTYALLLANPCLRSAIYAVFYRLVDCFDDKDLYINSAYFMLRAIK